MKPINDFEDLYGITENGTIISLRTGRKLKPFSNGHYLSVRLYKNSIKIDKRVHRLIAEAFIPNPQNLPQINHKDGNKLNNNISNLEWCTPSQNQKHAFKTGLQNNHNYENNPCVKLTKENVIQIKNLYQKYTRGKYTQKKLAEMHGVTQACISSIINNKHYIF